MFDIGWTELMVIGIVALIVVGPKDLPKMFRTLGQMTAKARGMAREFQRAMDDAADSSGVKDMARDLRKATDPQGMGLDELDRMRKWDPLKDDAKAKGAKPAPSDSSGGDDEEAFDQIAAEMDNIRKPKAPKADTPAPTDVPPAAPPKAPAASPERQDSAPDAQDKGKA